MNPSILSALIASGISVFVAVVGWAVAFGAMRSEVNNLKEDINGIADKMADVSNPRLQRLEDEIMRIRDWRHAVENELVAELFQARVEKKRRLAD